MENLPFGRQGRFYKGNLHTHSTNSDGSHSPERVIKFYREAGYDFLALSDHFRENFGWPITDTRALRGNGFTTLIAAELHAPETRIGETWHIKAIGLPLDFAPLAEGETGPGIAARALAAGAFIGLVHPSWYGLTVEDAREIPFAHAIEIYNHGNAVEVDRGDDWPFCDQLLNDGWRLSGYAADDAHFLSHDCLGGWVQVKADSPEPDVLLDALKAGRYYSSQGPEIHDIQIDGEAVHVDCSPAAAIIISGRGSKANYLRGDGLREARFPTARYREAYCRITIIDEVGKKAWSNPLWWN